MPPAPPARARRGGGVALGVLGTMLLAFFSIMFVMGRHTNLHTIYNRIVHDPRLGHHWMHEGEHAVLGAGAAARSQVRLLQQGQDMQRCALWQRLNCMCCAVAHSNCVLHVKCCMAHCCHAQSTSRHPRQPQPAGRSRPARRRSWSARHWWCRRLCLPQPQRLCLHHNQALCLHHSLAQCLNRQLQQKQLQSRTRRGMVCQLWTPSISQPSERGRASGVGTTGFLESVCGSRGQGQHRKHG